jgi:EAL domain-containing protein (putative c-di-GMP-specific phosphodiesterase class I)
VQALKDRGFAAALDDVGTGNSGLEMLRLIHFDYVKIARDVILDALRGGAGRAIILAITAFSREAGALVIAEGIENEAMLEVVQPGSPRLFSIQAVQGYFFGRPEPSVERYLEEASTKRS